jgi:hypothetical protein
MATDQRFFQAQVDPGPWVRLLALAPVAIAEIATAYGVSAGEVAVAGYVPRAVHELASDPTRPAVLVRVGR